MVEINYSIVDGDQICCLVDCSKKEHCANHSSALDMRTESGLRPKLKRKNGAIFCSTLENSFMKATFGAVTLQQLDRK